MRPIVDTARFDSGLRETRRFADTPRDTSVGIDVMGARAYVPDLGVWTAPDPVLLDDPAEYARSHPSHSAYVYANSNPVALGDPQGEFAFLAAAAAFVGVTFTAAVLEQHQSRAELAADMAKLSAQAYASIAGVRAVATAAAAGISATTQLAANAVSSIAVGEVTAAVQEKVVHAASNLHPSLGKATDVLLDVAPAVAGRPVQRKVSAGPAARGQSTHSRLRRPVGSMRAS